MAFFEMIRPYHFVIGPTDLRQITGKTIYEYIICVAKQNSFIVDTTMWSTIDLVNQSRRPNPTVAPREVKLRFWFFAASCRFLLTMARFFCITASRYESREHFRDTSMHKLRIRIDTDFHWKNTDFPHEIVACLYMYCIHIFYSFSCIYCLWTY